MYVKDGLDPGYTFDTPTKPVELDQKGCIYSPRVLGLMDGSVSTLAPLLQRPP